MPDLPIDDVHRLLETANAAIERIEAFEGPAIDIVDLPELIEITFEVDNPVGINVSLLNRIRKLNGKIQKRDALKIADRIRTFLKSQDQAFSRKPRLLQREHRAPKREPKRRGPAATQTVAAERWVVLGSSPDVKLKIGVIASLLDGIIEQITHSNVPPGHQLLTDIERRQLIAILETALNVLRSPMVEAGLLKKARTLLGSAAKSATEKQLQQGLGTLMNSAGERILELLRMLGIPV